MEKTFFIAAAAVSGRESGATKQAAAMCVRAADFIQRGTSIA